MLNISHRRFTLATIILSALGALPAAGQVINEDFKLTPSDGAESDYFGQSIAIGNGVVAVGAYGDDDNGFDSGSAYLFDASTGAPLFKLLASDGGTSSRFGQSIAIDNGVVAVGAAGQSGTSSVGSAFLFDASTGAQLFKLLASDGARNDYFGNSIAIDNGIVAVGAVGQSDNGSSAGSAYLFDVSTGAQLFKLLPNDGTVGVRFGNSIAIDNGIVAVGAHRDSDNGSTSGSAYLYDASTGAQLFKLLPSDGAEGDQFGQSIAIDNGIVAVGAAHDGDNGSFSGSAYLFDASTGAQLFKLLASDGAINDRLGQSIAIDNGVVAVGGYGDDDNGSTSGSAYLFDASTGKQLAKLLPSDGAENDYFGSAIAVENGIACIGALFDRDNGIQSGSAYLFDTNAAPCAADLTGDGMLDFFDISAFLTAFVNQDSAADFIGDGAFNFLDISAFLQAFGKGCP